MIRLSCQLCLKNFSRPFTSKIKLKKPKLTPLNEIKTSQASAISHKISNHDEIREGPNKFPLEEKPFLFIPKLPPLTAEEENLFEEQRKLKLLDVNANVPIDELPEVYSAKKIPNYYLSLSKARLTGLVAVTAMAGYAMAPLPFELSTFALLSMGTILTSASANTINQLIEISYDSQMDRTRNRVLVKKLLSQEHVIAFASVCAVSGASLLYFGCNTLTAILGVSNLILYTSVYTPMKRISIANTWVGSIVGAIPPVMGYTASVGNFGPGAYVLGGILFAWQFAHFNALSWNLKRDYQKAGYKMMSVENPELCKRTALRYSVALSLISASAAVFDVTSWTFVIDSLPFNIYLIYLSWNFYKNADSASSRKLFRYTLIHLPVIITLMIISRKYGIE